jgi:hypothetical protein
VAQVGRIVYQAWPILEHNRRRHGVIGKPEIVVLIISKFYLHFKSQLNTYNFKR